MENYPPISIDEFKVIEQYLQKSMPDDAYQNFSKKLSNDSDLKRKVETVRLQLIGVQEAVLASHIPEYHEEMSKPSGFNSQAPVRSINFKIYLVAASVTLLLAASVLFFLLSGKDQKLYARYYRPDPGLMTAMGVSDNYNFSHAMIDYKAGKYSSAIQSWERLLVTDNNNDTLNYFLGSAFLAKEQTDSALHYFNKVLTVSKSGFLSDTHWYLGLIYLSIKDNSKALEFLKKSDHENAAVLIDLLKKK